MMLGNNFYSKEIRENSDVRMSFNSLDKACLYFCTRIVLMVKNAEFRVSAFLVKVEFPVFLLVLRYAM